MESLDLAIKSSKWNDWKWQYKNRITNISELSKVINLSQNEKEDIDKCLQNFIMAITPYYASLINKEDINDPVRMQSVPTIFETYPCENDMRSITLGN